MVTLDFLHSDPGVQEYLFQMQVEAVSLFMIQSHKSHSLPSLYFVDYKWAQILPEFKGRGIRLHFLVKEWQVS